MRLVDLELALTLDLELALTFESINGSQEYFRISVPFLKIPNTEVRI